MRDATFNLDSFGKNQMLEGSRVIINNLHRLITMKKDTDQLNPDKGIDVNSYKHKFDDVIVLSELETKLTSQIEQYTPYTPAEINVRSKKNVIFIMITLVDDDNVYMFQSDGENSSLDILKEK